MHRLALGISTILLTALSCGAAPLPAQESDSQLLYSILCELKELRAAVQQAQVAAPLLEANLREREHYWQRRIEVEEQLRAAHQEAENSHQNQTALRNRIASLEQSHRQRADDRELAAALEQMKTVQLAEAASLIEQAERKRSLLAVESSNLAARVAELEHESARLQRQLQTLAAGSGMVCAEP